MKTKSSHSRMIMLGVMLAIGAAVTSGIIQNHNNILETEAASGSYVINFWDSANLSDTSTSTVIDTTYVNGKSSAAVSNVSAVSRAYQKRKGGIGLGSSGTPAAGFTLNLPTNVTSAHVYAANWTGAEAPTLSVGGATAQTVSIANSSITAATVIDDLTPYAYSFASTNAVVFSSAVKRIVIYQIVLNPVTKTLQSISASGAPSKTSYYAGESFSSTGLTINANYSDSTSTNVTADCTFTPNPLTAGTTSVTASYTEGGVTKTTSISGITVTARTLVSISVLTNPTTMTYKVGQAFSPTGMKIRATFNAGATNDDYVAYTYSPTAAFDSLGSKTITITSTENAAISTTLNVTVVDVAEGTYGITSGATVYQATMDPASLVIDKSDSLLSDLSFTAISNIRLYGNPITASIMMGSGSAVGGSFVIAVESGLVISKIEFVDNDKDSGAAGTMTLSVNTESVLFSAINTEDSIIFKPYTNSITIATTARLWTAQIILTAHKLTTAAVDYGTHFLASTATECSAQSVTTTTWNKLKATYVSADASVKSLIKAADANPSGDDLEEAIARYTSIVSKYAYEDYLDLGIVPHSNHISNDSQSNNAIIYVVVISFVGMTILVASRLMRKKNEEVA